MCRPLFPFLITHHSYLPMNYLAHLLVWMFPVIALQWALSWRVFVRHRRAILWPTLIAGSYYTVVDMVAVREGIWYFDPSRIIGVHLGPLPIEEVLFFYITALLVAQSVVMLLPARLRGEEGERGEKRG